MKAGTMIKAGDTRINNMMVAEDWIVVHSTVGADKDGNGGKKVSEKLPNPPSKEFLAACKAELNAQKG